MKRTSIPFDQCERVLVSRSSHPSDITYLFGPHSDVFVTVEAIFDACINIVPSSRKSSQSSIKRKTMKVSISFVVTAFLPVTFSASCPCDVNPATCCSPSGTYGCNYLPRMNDHSMETMLLDFAANADISVYPIRCDQNTGGPGLSIQVGDRNDVVAECQSGGQECTSFANCGTVCSANSDNSGMACNTDQDCPPNNGNNQGTCGQDTCVGLGPPYGPHGNLYLSADGDTCLASHRYRDGPIGYGTTYSDNYYVTGLSPSQAAACRQAIQTVCNILVY